MKYNDSQFSDMIREYKVKKKKHLKKLLLFFKQNKHKFIQLPISKMKNS